jgi:hypothetical protein
MLRLHSRLVRFQLPRYPRRHIQQPRICHGVIRPCLGALNGLSTLSILFMAGLMSIIRAPAAWSSFTLLHIYLWWYQEHFSYTVIQCDVIDTLVESDLANGCGGRDLVYLLAWRSLMLLVHNEPICFENTMGALGVEIG